MSEAHDAEVLVALSDIDLGILRAQKHLDELPQKQQIIAVRHKLKELETKAGQVEKLAADSSRILKLLSDETVLNNEHMAEIQASLNKSNAYRETTSLAAEMEMLAGRKAKLEEDSLIQMEKQEKIATVQAQINVAARKLTAEEQAHTNSYREEGGKLKQDIADLERARENLCATLGPNVAQRYQKAVATKQGIGAAHLVKNQCSGCHATLSEGQVAKLVEGPPIGECPSCNRLMVSIG